MDLVFVVPGIMGSELHLKGDKIWPPKMLQRVSNPDQLLDPNVETGKIIRNVLVFGFYEKLLDPLADWGYLEGQAGHKGLVIPWPYNWVRGIPENARLLSADLRKAARNHPDKTIVLLAHSMGGLICTYALECLSELDSSWRDKVRLLVTFGTPFRGAPESLKNAFGVEGAMGITAIDCWRLMADRRFPSAYQLFPHLSTLSCWLNQPPLYPVLDYQSFATSDLSLGSENLSAAINFQRDLLDGVPVSTVRKFNFCGSRHSTVWAVGTPNDPRDILDPYEAKAGDGTVPSWSGRHNDTVQFAPLGAKHSTTFGDDNVLEILHDLLVTPTAPKKPGPGGGGGRLNKRLPASPQDQPRISVTKNAISSQRTSVEVELSDPPIGGALYFSWIRLHEIETMQEIGEFLSRAEFKIIEASHVFSISDELDFPQQLTIPRPSQVGQYALVAWSGSPSRSVGDLDVSRMDAVWVFADQHQEGTIGGTFNVFGAPSTPLDATAAEASRSLQERAAQELWHFSAD